MVRVLIVARAPVGDERIGGIANFIRGFVQFMPPDFEAEIVGVAVGEETPGTRWHEVKLAGRDVRFLPVARIGSARRTGRVPIAARISAGMLRHRRLIATAERVAQVHAPAMDLGLAGRRLPIVRVVHNDPRELAGSAGESTWRRLGRGLRLVERSTFRRAARVYFVNRGSLEQYSREFPDVAARMRFIANGIDPSMFRPLFGDERAAARTRLAVELGISADDAWLVFAGRLDPQKDPELLVRAMAEFDGRDGRRDARLLVIGDGNLRAATEQLAKDLGIAARVTFLGLWPRERLAGLLPAADAFVLASAFEAAPFAVLEALAAGLPVVSTAVGEVPAMVEHANTGWIAAERTPAALADGIAWALAQPRDDVAGHASSSMTRYHLANVLAPLYEDFRLLAEQADKVAA